jgi:cytidylate kinase
MSLIEDNVHWDSLVDKQLRLWREQQNKNKRDSAPCPWDSVHLTISRAYGSRGYRIGQLIGEKLHWEVYSRQLTEYIAERSNLRHKVVADFDEKKRIRSISQTLFQPSAYTSDKYYRHLVQVILSLADYGRAIFVGRGINFITDHKNGMHVRVTASLESRIERYAKRHDVSEKEARKKVESVDKERDDYIRHYFHQDTTDPHHYDMVINVEHYTNEQVAEMIIAAMEVKFDHPRPKRPAEDSSCDEEN